MQDEIRRSILFLINGFGVDRKDLYDICTDETIPYLNKLARENLYSTMINVASDYKNGYRMFSTGQKELPGYNKVDMDLENNFDKNDKFNKIATEIASRNKKLHIFCYLDNEITINQTKKIIDNLKKKGNKHIYLHVILNSLKNLNYKIIEKNIQSLKIIVLSNSEVKFGVFFGVSQVDQDIEFTKELYQVLITEVGERWPDFTRKVEILNERNIKPGDVKPFFISGDFKIQTGDSIIFLNYEYVDYSNFINIFQNPKKYFSLSNLPENINIYSLFPLKSKVQIPSIYDYEESENYLVKYLEKIHSKALVITTSNRIGYINNYCNGLKNVKSDKLDFMLLDDNIPIANIVTNPNYQFFIFDFDISNSNNIDELKSNLKKADTMLGKVAYQCKLYDYSLFISSFYGIKKEWKRGQNQYYNIDYTHDMPLIIVDRLVIRGKHFVTQGSILYLLPTIIKNMNSDMNIPSLISSKSGGLLSIFGQK